MAARGRNRRIIAALLASGARAETIGGALAKAYLNNPDINQQRAAVRAQDENIPKANSGYLPNISAEGDVGRSHDGSERHARAVATKARQPRRAATASP